MISHLFFCSIYGPSLKQGPNYAGLCRTAWVCSALGKLQADGQRWDLPYSGQALKGKGRWSWFFPQDHIERPGQNLELNQFLPNFKGCISTVQSAVSFQALVNISMLTHIFENKSLLLWTLPAIPVGSCPFLNRREVQCHKVCLGFRGERRFPWVGQALSGKMRGSSRLCLALSCQSIRQNVPYGENRLPACSNRQAAEWRGGCSSERAVEWCPSYPALLQDKTVINQHGATLPWSVCAMRRVYCARKNV